MSAAFDRWRHGPTQRAAIMLGYATRSSFTCNDQLSLTCVQHTKTFAKMFCVKHFKNIL